MHVDGREVTVSGNLLQPLTRRTNDMLRVALSGALLAIVITSSLVTRTRWDELEKSISRIVGVLTPTQSDVVYLVYGLAVLALPLDRKSTRLNSSHPSISYAVFCLKKKTNTVYTVRWHKKKQVKTFNN